MNTKLADSGIKCHGFFLFDLLLLDLLVHDLAYVVKHSQCAQNH